LNAIKDTVVAGCFLSHPVFAQVALSGPRRWSQGENELAYHTIAKVAFDRVELKWPRKVGKNARLDVHGNGSSADVCIITTNKGAIGWGMVRGRKNAGELVSKLSGKKVSEVFSPQAGVTDLAYLPFDIALHDLAGIILQKPVYALMGRETPLVTDCYSGMIYFDDLEPEGNPAGIDKILEECRYDYDFGYRQFKLKIGRGNKWMPKNQGLKRDIEVTKAVARHFPQCAILVDGNNGFTAAEFIRYMEGIGDIALFWIEEPFHETEADYRQLKDWLVANNISTLLADGEHDPDEALLRDLAKKKLIDVHLTDIIGYGFTPWRRLMPELQKTGTLASPHAWGTLLKTHYIAHLAGALGNTVTIEGVTCTSDDVDLSGYKLENGKLIPPPTPGFGMRLLKNGMI